MESWGGYCLVRPRLEHLPANASIRRATGHSACVELAFLHIASFGTVQHFCCKTIFSLLRKEHFSRSKPQARNFDSQNRPFGFYYCRFSLIGCPHRDFCNTIGTKRPAPFLRAPQEFQVHRAGQPLFTRTRLVVRLRGMRTSRTDPELAPGSRHVLPAAEALALLDLSD